MTARSPIRPAVYLTTRESLELIIVDDGSTDGTDLVVSSFNDDRIRYVKSHHNRGPAVARNLGLAAAEGMYIAYLDSDDWWDSDFLRVMINEAARTQHDFLYSAQRVIKSPNRKRADGRRPELIRFAPYSASLLENSNYISQISVLHRRDLGSKVGGFDERFRKYVDWEFFLRLADESPPLAVPAILSHYNQGETASVSSSFDRTEWLHRIWATTCASPIDVDALASFPPADSSRFIERNGEHVQAMREAIQVRRSWPGYRLSTLRAVPESRRQLKRRVTVIVPSYGVPNYLRVCLAAIVKFTPREQIDLVVVDNGSSDDVKRVLDDFERPGYLRSIRNRTNLGFSQAVNQGLTTSDARADVVILNNDSLVTPGWLQELSAVAHTYSDAGIVAPRQVLLPNDPTLNSHVPGAIEDFECDTNISAHHDNLLDPYFDTKRAVSELRFVPFFCVFIRRETIDTCGNIDARMGVHYQSDWVYCDAVRNVAGRKILHTSKSKVYHFNGQATKELRASNQLEFDSMARREDWKAIKRTDQQED